MQYVSSLSGSGISLTRPALESVSSFVGLRLPLARPVLVYLETVWSFVGVGVGLGSFSDTHGSRVYQVFCRLGRLSIKPIVEYI